MTNATTNGNINASDAEGQMRLEDACDIFVDKVKNITGVQEVFLVNDPENYPVMWTIMSTERLNFEARSSIYGVECDLLRMPYMPILDFRILNLQETTSDNLWDYLPSESSKSLWKREYAQTS